MRYEFNAEEFDKEATQVQMAFWEEGGYQGEHVPYHAVISTARDIAQLAIHCFRVDLAPDVNQYAEIADAIHIERGGHPRDRIALYPPEFED